MRVGPTHPAVQSLIAALDAELFQRYPNDVLNGSMLQEAAFCSLCATCRRLVAVRFGRWIRTRLKSSAGAAGGA